MCIGWHFCVINRLSYIFWDHICDFISETDLVTLSSSHWLIYYFILNFVVALFLILNLKWHMLNFIRWDKVSPWESAVGNKGSNWRETVLAVMQQYTEELDGSYIEHKESALVWHYQDANPYFGSCLAKGLFENLQNIFADGMTRGGHNIAEVDPQVQFRRAQVI